MYHILHHIASTTSFGLPSYRSTPVRLSGAEAAGNSGTTAHGNSSGFNPTTSSLAEHGVPGTDGFVTVRRG